MRCFFTQPTASRRSPTAPPNPDRACHRHHRARSTRRAVAQAKHRLFKSLFRRRRADDNDAGPRRNDPDYLKSGTG